MKWFSIKGIKEEIGKVRWPKKKEVFNNSLISVCFVAILTVFFFLCQVVSSGFLKLIGM